MGGPAARVADALPRPYHARMRTFCAPVGRAVRPGFRAAIVGGLLHALSAALPGAAAAAAPGADPSSAGVRSRFPAAPT